MSFPMVRYDAVIPTPKDYHLDQQRNKVTGTPSCTECELFIIVIPIARTIFNKKIFCVSKQL